MRRITKLRGAIYILATPFLVILYLNIEKWAEKRGYDLLLANLDTSKDGTVGEALLSIVLHPAMSYIAVGVLSFTLGVWIDSVIRKSDPDQQPAPDDYKIDPWVAAGQRTFAKVNIDIDNWRAEAIEKENIYEVKVNFIGEEHESIEMFVVFDRWVAAPGLTINCDRRKDGYRTEQIILSDRYAICRLHNINLPCTVELDFDP